MNQNLTPISVVNKAETEINNRIKSYKNTKNDHTLKLKEVHNLLIKAQDTEDRLDIFTALEETLAIIKHESKLQLITQIETILEQ